MVYAYAPHFRPAHVQISIDLKNSWKVKAFCRKDFAKFEVLSDRKGEVELRPTVEPIKKLTGYEITG